jgi:hypothetical protein
MPFIEGEKNELDGEKKEQDAQDIEEAHFRASFLLDHETYRKEVWLPYKLFRGSNDNERFMSETILE